MWVVLLTTLMLQAGVLTYVAVNNRQYLDDYRLAANPDARQYVLLGENALTKGKYSRQSEAPYRPDVLRTPVYPLLAGAAQAATHRIWLLYLVQMLLNSLTAVLVYRAALLVFGRRIAMAAGLLYASDLTLVVLTLSPMTEILYSFLTTLALLVWLTGLTRGPLDRRYGLSVVVGGILGVAILTRPAGVYLPLLMAGVEFALGRHEWRLAMKRSVAVLVSAYVLVAPWIVRNRVLYGLSRLTTADTINLTYFAAAGVYQLKYGIEREAAQDRIAREFGLPTLLESNNFWVTSLDVATMDARERHAAQKVLLGAPLTFLRASALGIFKSSVSHNVDELAHVAGQTWSDGVARKLMTGRWRDVGIAPALLVAFLWQVLMAGAGLLLACLGAVRAMRAGMPRRHVVALGGVAAYALLTTAIVGIDAYSRHRAAVLPVQCIFAGIGLVACVDLFASAITRRGRDVARSEIAA